MRRTSALLLFFILAFISPLLGAERNGQCDIRAISSFEGCTAAKMEKNDTLLVSQDGKLYKYVATAAGKEVVFTLIDGDLQNGYPSGGNAVAYFNVDSVLPDGSAAFSIKAEQYAGEMSNRLPQYALLEFNGTDEVKALMQPLASVLEFSAGAESYFHSDRVVLLPPSVASGFAAAKNIKFNPYTGEMSADKTASSKTTVGLNVGDVDMSAGLKAHFIVGCLNTGGAGIVLNFFKGFTNNRRDVVFKGDDPGFAGNKCYKSIGLGSKKVGISSPEDFYDFAISVSKGDHHALKYCNEDGVLILNSDIDLSKYANYDKDWSGVGELWADIDGCGHCIYGYKIARNGNAAIFNTVNASVRNLQFGKPGDGSCIETSRAGYCMAAPIGSMKNPNTIVENCRNYSAISSTHVCSNSVYIGGLVAMSMASFKNCSNYGNLTLDCSKQISNKSIKCIGGIAGSIIGDQGTHNNVIASCVNYGKIMCKTSQVVYMGGIIGRFAETSRNYKVVSCVNNAALSMADGREMLQFASAIGGITGELAPTWIVPHGASHHLENCENNGEIKVQADGRLSIGGIAGRARTSYIKHCTNNALIEHTVSGETDFSRVQNNVYQGGIVGSAMDNSILEDCTNSSRGAIVSTQMIPHRCGGIAGLLSKSQIISCANAAQVEVSIKRMTTTLCASAGICALQDGSPSDLVSNCKNTGVIRLTASAKGSNCVAAGIVAVLHRGIVEKSENKGGVEATNELVLPDISSFAGGIVGRAYSEDAKGVYNNTNSGKVKASAPYSSEPGDVLSDAIIAESQGVAVQNNKTL